MNTEQKAGAEGGRVEGEGRLEERQGQGRAQAGVGAPRLGVRGMTGQGRLGGGGWVLVKVGGCGGHGNHAKVGGKVRLRRGRNHSLKRNARLKEG